MGFKASFTIDDVLYTFTGTITPAVSFTCKRAEVILLGPNDHKIKHLYTGTVGPVDFQFRDEKGILMQGILDHAMSESIAVEGIWS